MAYVLIIDNDEILRSVLIEQMKRVGIPAKEADNGLTGLEMVKQERPAVIVLDEHMPKMNGQQFIEALKKEGLLEGQRIIVFTGLHDTDLMNHKMLAGISDYLDKGTTTPESVVNLVQSYLPPSSAAHTQ
jgi:CheY-like chemotaxis protein